MKDKFTNKESLYKYGFCIVRNLLNDDEVKKYKFAIKQINEKNGKESTVDLHNHREIWEYFVNDRLLNVLKNLLGQNVYYLHNCSTLHQDNVTVKQSWHRDNACRIVGKGPDWDNNLPYNVLTVITYLSSFEETMSGITLIPYSHKKNYPRSLSNLLRILHWKTRNFKFLQIIRSLIQKHIGITCRTDSGDCIIFFANLFHQGLPTKGLRQAIIAQFGPDNKHSKNFVNYSLKHRKYFSYEDDKINSRDFFALLKSKDIYYPLPDKKEHIEGVSVPKDEAY